MDALELLGDTGANGSMMNPAWPERIDCGQGWKALRNGRLNGPLQKQDRVTFLASDLHGENRRAGVYARVRENDQPTGPCPACCNKRLGDRKEVREMAWSFKTEPPRATVRCHASRPGRCGPVALGKWRFDILALCWLQR